MNITKYSVTVATLQEIAKKAKTITEKRKTEEEEKKKKNARYQEWLQKNKFDEINMLLKDNGKIIEMYKLIDIFNKIKKL